MTTATETEPTEQKKTEIFGFASRKVKESVVITLRAYTWRGDNGLFYVRVREKEREIAVNVFTPEYHEWLKERKLFQKLTELGHFGDIHWARFLDILTSHMSVNDDEHEMPVVAPLISNWAALIPVHHKDSQKHFDELCRRIDFRCANVKLLAEYALVESVGRESIEAVRDFQELMDKYFAEKDLGKWHLYRLQMAERIEQPLHIPSFSSLGGIPEDPHIEDIVDFILRFARAISPQQYRETRKKLFDFVDEALRHLGQEWEVKPEFIKEPKKIKGLSKLRR